MGIEIRPAVRSDALALAALYDIAGNALPSFLWARIAANAASVFEVGRGRAQRDDASFSWRNATVAIFDEEVVGMAIGYRQPRRFDRDAIEKANRAAQPVLELEALAPDSWFFSALGVFPDFRSQGVGSRLLDLAVKRAWRDGAKVISHIVIEGNEGAVRLFLRKGYAIVERRPSVRYTGAVHAGDWLLMSRAVQE